MRRRTRRETDGQRSTMKTTLRIEDSMRLANISCSRIWAVFRFVAFFMVPVAQNRQPILQPTCDDTQSVDQ